MHIEITPVQYTDKKSVLLVVEELVEVFKRFSEHTVQQSLLSRSLKFLSVSLAEKGHSGSDARTKFNSVVEEQIIETLTSASASASTCTFIHTYTKYRHHNSFRYNTLQYFTSLCKTLHHITRHYTALRLLSRCASGGILAKAGSLGGRR